MITPSTIAQDSSSVLKLDSPTLHLDRGYTLPPVPEEKLRTVEDIWNQVSSPDLSQTHPDRTKTEKDNPKILLLPEKSTQQLHKQPQKQDETSNVIQEKMTDPVIELQPKDNVFFSADQPFIQHPTQIPHTEKILLENRALPTPKNITFKDSSFYKSLLTQNKKNIKYTEHKFNKNSDTKYALVAYEEPLIHNTYLYSTLKLAQQSGQEYQEVWASPKLEGKIDQILFKNFSEDTNADELIIIINSGHNDLKQLRVYQYSNLNTLESILSLKSIYHGELFFGDRMILISEFITKAFNKTVLYFWDKDKFSKVEL